MLHSPLSYALLVVLLGAPGLALATCPAEPRTDYEKIYCQLAEKGEGSSLPSFEDFRRNDPGVQALLLKRPAARLGIEVPAPAAAKMASPATRPAARKAASETPETAAAKPRPAPRPEGATTAGGLVDCKLNGEAIACPHQRFELATNQPNRALAPGVLEEDNTLDLASFNGNLDDETKVRAYLADAYDRYIAKMLEIGLGGATMSFTRFYYSFERHEAQGIDFAERMESTYHYLKQDKRHLGVSARLNEALPGSLKDCAPAGTRIIVCDNVATNWVYVAR